MNVLITIPTEAQDVRPGQLVHHESAAWEVDEVAHQRDGSVKIAVRPSDRKDGRRSILSHASDALLQVLPTRDQRDHLAPVIADALGTSWLTQVLGLTDDAPETWDEVITEELGVEWRNGRVHPLVEPEHERWRGDSVTLNTVLWRLALLLGDVVEGQPFAVLPGGVDEAAQDLTVRVADLVKGRGVLQSIDLSNIEVVDELLQAIEAVHPTAIADHARMRERSAGERRALAETQPAEPRPPALDGVILSPLGICPTSNKSADDCELDHVHIEWMPPEEPYGSDVQPEPDDEPAILPGSMPMSPPPDTDRDGPGYRDPMG